MCCYVDDEALKFGFNMYFEICFEMEWFGAQNVFSIFPLLLLRMWIVPLLNQIILFGHCVSISYCCFIVMCHG